MIRRISALWLAMMLASAASAQTPAMAPPAARAAAAPRVPLPRPSPLRETASIETKTVSQTEKLSSSVAGLLATLGTVSGTPAAAIPQIPEPPVPATPKIRISPFDEIIAKHAHEHGVPETLVHRVIVRESKYQPHLIGHGGTIGLMQIKLGTARGIGYTGDAEGLRDPATNLAFGIKYLAGAYRTAQGNYDRAVFYYARGYYYAAKAQRAQAALARQSNPEAR